MYHRNIRFSDGGRAVLIEPPDDAVISLTDAKKALGMSLSDASQDAALTLAIAAASDVLDPAAGGWLGRALRPQSWELQLPSFGAHSYRFHMSPRHPVGSHRIELPYPPLLSVDSVVYTDVNGVDQPLVLDTGYRVLGMGQVYGKAMIAPLYGQSWPVARVDDASVRIQFTCGYDDDDAVMPATLKNAVIIGARALLSIATRDMTLLEDRVEGMGWKRYQNTPAVAQIVDKAIKWLLANLTIPAI